MEIKNLCCVPTGQPMMPIMDKEGRVILSPEVAALLWRAASELENHNAYDQQYTDPDFIAALKDAATPILVK